ncbi:mycothiol system anti-sigma-R factor [Winkia neuii]|uniref:Mycothiol system anti-sigma-R factor n=1 Tax=Winkia neuii TaxID=33007 RepID=A0A2I1IP06_9ACTO|nr:mycothiol system anti-sigma-R factor [Winkia neuii]
MSCGCDNDDCRCDEVMAKLYEFVDETLTAAQIHKLAAHISACPHCAGRAQAERDFRALMARQCCECAPPSLRGRIVQTIAASDGENGMSITISQSY